MTSDGRRQVLVSQVGGTYVPLEYTEIVEDLIPTASSSSSFKSDHSGSGGDKDMISMSMENESDDKRRSSDTINPKQNKTQKIPRHSSTGDMSETKLRRNSSRSSFKGPEILLSRYQLQVNGIVGLAQRNSPSSVTEVVGDLTSITDLFDEQDKHSNIVALCTLDGWPFCYYFHLLFLLV